MDRGTAVPQPVLAGTDTHHGTRGPVTLQRFSLRMLGSAGNTGICRRCRDLPTLAFACVFAGTTAFSLLQGGVFLLGVLGVFF